MRWALALVSLILFGSIALAQAQGVPNILDYLQNAAGTGTPPTGASSPVDLLFEANSYVPPFYHGRPLPSAGSTMRFVAVAHFSDAKGAAVPNDQIMYTWSVDGRVQGNSSGAGKSSVILAAPGLFGNNTVSVEARTQDGSAYGGATVSIGSVDPKPILYEDHPLYGIEYDNALSGQTAISDTEMTFVAAPYFVAATNPDDPALRWNWSINGVPIAATSSGSEITLNANNSNGLADLSVTLNARNNPLLNGSGAWSMLFSTQSTH